MIDKYRLDDLRLESGEKGELARWVIQLQTDLDNERRKAGNSPAIPEGYVLVPREPTAEMIAAAMDCEDVLFNSDETFCVQFGNIYAAMLAAAPQEVNHG
ncbi:hypothetical protein ABW09_23460 [Pluralibacter gergoviae]|uniref:hypothetical protein n=1 Tax=Pluralibacter gergoviae TaxID=61647 RepID=UPI000651E92A|nr:hypothetical protein [Pluralibacter gergoviae]KMK13560.1 hypothetical protein ABW09_23460 [Pluralibacter gergoviae]